MGTLATHLALVLKLLLKYESYLKICKIVMQTFCTSRYVSLLYIVKDL